MFTIYEVEDDRIVVRSADSGDIARVFRLLNYDLPIGNGVRINSVYVTILKEDLTEENHNAKLTEDQREPDPAAEPSQLTIF